MNVDALMDEAFSVRSHSYSPYSHYAVGAAILAGDGTVWRGTNVENVSYGVCLCAERAALGAMVSAGVREIAQIAVATRDGATPCGMCVQALLEFAPNADLVLVHVQNAAGERHTFRLRELAPYAFSSKDVGDSTGLENV